MLISWSIGLKSPYHENGLPSVKGKIHGGKSRRSHEEFLLNQCGDIKIIKINYFHLLHWVDRNSLWILRDFHPCK